MSIDVKESVHQELLEFLRAADRIQSIQLRTFDSSKGLNNENCINYALIKRRENRCLDHDKRFNKCTQTSYSKSDINIDGRECWNYGTLSHSLLQVSFVILLSITLIWIFTTMYCDTLDNIDVMLNMLRTHFIEGQGCYKNCFS